MPQSRRQHAGSRGTASAGDSAPAADAD